MSRFRVPVRVLVAFLSGWFAAFSNILGLVAGPLANYARDTWNMYSGTFLPLFFLSIALLLGVVAPLSVNWQKKYALPLALLTGFSVITGYYAYLLPDAIRSDTQPCDVYCQHGPLGRNATGLLLVIWLLTVLLTLISTLITSLLIYVTKRLSHKWLRADQ